MFAAIAAGVAQERMMRMSGWRPGIQLPHWAATVSDVVVGLLRAKGFTVGQLWDAMGVVEDDGWVDHPHFSVDGDEYLASDPRSALPAGTYVATYSTGMQLWWQDQVVDYHEGPAGATVAVPTEWLVAGNTAAPIGRQLGEVCADDHVMVQVLRQYTIVFMSAISSELDARTPAAHQTELRLAVPMRTLAAIPDRALIRAGVPVVANLDSDLPLWMLTPPELLLRYRPRLAQEE